MGSKDRKKMAVTKTGKNAITHFKVIERYQKTEKKWTEWGNYYYHDWAICLGPNGNKITFEKTGLYEATDSLTRTSEIFFWLNDKESNCASITFDSLNIGSENMFSGYKLPIRLVKR